MQKIIRVIDDNFSIVQNHLDTGWKIINMQACSTAGNPYLSHNDKVNTYLYNAQIHSVLYVVLEL